MGGTMSTPSRVQLWEFFSSRVMDDWRTVVKQVITVIFVLNTMVKVPTLLDSTDLCDVREYLPSKGLPKNTTLRCFQGRRFTMISTDDNVSTILNDPPEEDLSKCYELRTPVVTLREVISSVDVPISVILILALLSIISEIKSGTMNLIPNTQKNEPQATLEMVRETDMHVHVAFDKIKNSNKDVENDTIPLLLDDQLAEYPTTPEADVLPRQGMVEVV